MKPHTPPSPPRPKVKVPPPPVPTAAFRCGCDGCRDAPWPDCVCGAPAIVAFTDHLYDHAIPFCRDCLLIVLESRYGPKRTAPAKAAEYLSMSYDAIQSRKRRARKLEAKKTAWEQERLVTA